MSEPIYIAGPTGSGKSGFATALAREIGGEIVAADAFQLYAGLPLLTAAPTEEERRLVPHHLYGILDPTEECNAARFAELARACISEIASRGARPLVVGGSGLYLKALTHGLSDVPPADPELRAEFENASLRELVERYQGLDPQGAAEMNLKNRRYVERALEMTLASGRPASELKREWQQSNPKFDGVVLARERADLYARIDRRVLQMVADGLFDEVARIGDVGPGLARAIGLREVQSHLAGEISEAECIAQIQTATRRYAKRQLTWFRREKGFQTVCLAMDDAPDSAVPSLLALFPK